MDREAKRALGWVARALWDSVLVGDPAPVVRARYERMKNPQPGDLIMETSTIYRLLLNDPDLTDDRWDGQFVPFLRHDTIEHPPAPDDPYDEGWTEPVIVVENPDGTEFVWTNADVIALPSALWDEHAIAKSTPGPPERTP